VARKRIKQRAQVGVLGKALTRRSRGRCELCEGREGVRLHELPPFPEDPDPERTLMACGRCRGWLETQRIEAVGAHFLAGAVWSEVDAVKLAANRLLLCHEGQGEPWVVEALDVCPVDPQTREWA
jgi:protein PhnA